MTGTGSLTYWQLAKVAPNMVVKTALCGVAMRGLGDRVAYAHGAPTPRTQHILTAAARCTTAPELRRVIERFGGCQYCGGEITERATCPCCGVERDLQ